jgi:membrane protein YdbS with pleckstrin-like domain
METINTFQQAQEECQVIKPSIKTILLLLYAFGITLSITIFLALFLGGFMMSLAMALFGLGGVVAVLVLDVLLFIIIFIVTYYIHKASLKRTEYRFYSNRIEYFEGFLVKNRKTISYDKISNIGQRKGIIEGWFGLGTIFIDTPGSSPRGHELSIPYLENPDQVYDWMSKIISKKV